MIDIPSDDYDAILITGPTASGKSALALKLAESHNGVVINADSMQVYDTLRVVTARPSVDDMGSIDHVLYGHIGANTLYSTGDWLREAKATIEKLRDKGKMPVVIGGTGLYFKALTGGLSDMPDIPAELRETLRARAADGALPALYAELSALDPETAARLDPADAQRIIRALEVVLVSGKSIRHFQSQSGPVIIDAARAKKLVVLPERSLLHARINARFERMMDEGAVEEVKALLAQNVAPDMPVMKAIGVLQIAAMLRGEMSRPDVILTASAATRQYAKRQMTWFRNQMDESWQRVEP